MTNAMRKFIYYFKKLFNKKHSPKSSKSVNDLSKWYKGYLKKLQKRSLKELGEGMAYL